MPFRPLIPSWIHSNSPLYLNESIRRRIRRDFDPMGIFLNIPYAREYVRFELAIISTVTAYGLKPRMARERMRVEPRLLKIVELICCCQFGLTDLTYTRRMNMALELGILLAFYKENFITSRKYYSSLKTVSDLNFADIYYHGGSLRRLIVGLSKWIEQNCSDKRLTTPTLLRRYRRLRTIRKKLGDDFDRLKPQDISKLLGVARDEFGMLLS